MRTRSGRTNAEHCFPLERTNARHTCDCDARSDSERGEPKGDPKVTVLLAVLLVERRWVQSTQQPLLSGKELFVRSQKKAGHLSLLTRQTNGKTCCPLWLKNDVSAFWTQPDSGGQVSRSWPAPWFPGEIEMQCCVSPQLLQLHFGYKFRQVAPPPKNTVQQKQACHSSGVQ